MSDVARKTVLAIVLLEVLEEGEETKTRGKTRKWIKRREDKGFYQNIVCELRMEDTGLQGNVENGPPVLYVYILSAIEKDITPGELEKGGLKPIHPAERLTLVILKSHPTL